MVNLPPRGVIQGMGTITAEEKDSGRPKEGRQG